MPVLSKHCQAPHPILKRGILWCPQLLISDGKANAVVTDSKKMDDLSERQEVAEAKVLGSEGISREGDLT